MESKCYLKAKIKGTQIWKSTLLSQFVFNKSLASLSGFFSFCLVSYISVLKHCKAFPPSSNVMGVCLGRAGDGQ